MQLGASATSTRIFESTAFDRGEQGKAEHGAGPNLDVEVRPRRVADA
jgi:hypothetical protein